MAAEPPVLPGRDEARRWAEEELAKPEYRDAAPGWLDTVWADILDWLRSLDGGSGPDTTVAAPWIGVAIAVLIGAAVVLARPRLNAKAKRAGDVFDAGTTVSAEAYRGRAAAAAAAGNWSAAIVDCFRALVRTAEDRTLFDARPGRTADEVAHELATPFPSEAGRLTEAARTFDGIRYGNESAGQADFAAVRELDIALQSLTPASAALPAERNEPAVPR
ncbi:DUF4129 domain-containing protein [Pseudarthrobacter raffinosi]|uniref:DUF4129 domain-containing protein n=1 Tax=Pseudarthrobacter raffinosi TaxID=2953651 RepID=UPI00208FA993|nr:MULTISPECIES: DUF4129 domain-containing protein [unclassified Pseudarthrobacter]MCO4235844.1 DUF4129 domain-containing protein [Pseudarthrobacter sp. MDT3-28]MCO4250970.1 DUF4129 domain-containing protein [Pseudarthrobacter sp. MDT3-9]MCO4263860.1 DUF4129 domain-containing protein [Pseudarthrobacter sp. MDT3-26]